MATRDDFTGPDTGPFLLGYLRDPDLDLYSLEERPGTCACARGAGLDDVASPAWVGRRQGHFSVRVAARLEFHHEAAGEEAGLVVRMNERHHYEILRTRRDGQPAVVLRRRIGSLQAEVASRPLSPGEASGLVLAVDADRDRYRFSHGPAADALRPLGEGETRYLSTEVAGGFTGVFFAMYASGNGVRCQRPADFDWFEYAPNEDVPATGGG
jgi:alpha-N-arabinofuranosidase